MTDPFTMRDALRDPLFRKWMQKPPRFSPPKWRLFVLRNGTWGTAEFETYAEGYRALAMFLKSPSVEDAALNCPSRATRQPVVRNALGMRVPWVPEGLPLVGFWRWCPNCRRHTRFGYFRSHRMGRKKPMRVSDEEKRCVICGLSEFMARRGSK